MDTKITIDSNEIGVPENLGDVIKAYTKEVIRSKVDPKELLKFSRDYFESLLPKESEEVSEKKGNLRPLVVCGPSGVGKGTVIKLLFVDHSDKFEFSVSHTTRGKRKGEIEGKDYYYTSVDKMEKMIADKKFVEFAKVHTNIYGSSFASVRKVISTGKICVLDIDLQGAEKLSKHKEFNPCIVFILPPSMELLEKRLRDRKTETEDSIKVRLATAKREMKFFEENKDMFSFTVVNDDLQVAYKEFKEKVFKEYNLS